MLRLLLPTLFIQFCISSSYAAQTPSQIFEQQQREKFEECKTKRGHKWEYTASGGDGPAVGNCVADDDFKEEVKECRDAVKEYKDQTKADGELMKQCAANKTAGSAAKCLEAANVCRSCTGERDNDDEDSEDGAFCEDNDDDDFDDDSDDKISGVNALIEAYNGKQPGQSAQSRRQTKIDARNTMVRFQNCPVYAVEEFDDIVEKKEKYDEDVKSAKEDIPALMKELGEAEAELKKAQKEQAKLFPELEKDIQKITKNADKTLQAELEKNGKEIIAKLLEIQNTEIAFSQNKDKIIEPCFAKAEAALQNLKTTRNDKIRRGALRTKGGFAGLANNTNKKIYFRNYALGIYQDCLDNNTLIKKSLRTAEALHKQNLKVLQLQMQELQKTQRSIANKMMGTSPNDAMQAELDARNEQFEKESEAAAEKAEAALRAYQNAKILLEKRQQELREAEYLFGVYLDQEKVAKSVGARKGNKGDASGDGFMKAAMSFEAALKNAYYVCKCDSRDLNEKNPRCGSIDGDISSSKIEMPEDRSTTGSGSGTGSNRPAVR